MFFVRKVTGSRGGLILDRFVDCEKWRKEFGTDDLARNFNYVEKPKVFEYYPQYYHKTDKVRSRSVTMGRGVYAFG